MGIRRTLDTKESWMGMFNLKDPAGADPASPRPAKPKGRERKGKAGGMGPERRVKTLSKVTAAACFVAILAVGTGAWSQMTAAAKMGVLDEQTMGVLVASRDISMGEAVDQSAFHEASVPTSLVVSGALADASELSGDVALTDIPKGTQLSENFFSGGANTSSLANALASGKVAVSLSVDAEKGLSGLLRQGDAVEVLSFEDTTEGTSEPVVVCNRATVVALDALLDKPSDAYTSVTLAVNDVEAADIRAAQAESSISLVLVAAADSVLNGGN